MKSLRIISASVVAGLMLPVPALCQSLVPYEYMQNIQASACGGNQCILTFPAVPAGKRLVVTSVSAQVPYNMSAMVLQNGAALYFVPNPSTSGYISAQIALYYDPGVKPQARVPLPSGTSPTASITVTLVGNLVPA